MSGPGGEVTCCSESLRGEGSWFGHEVHDTGALQSWQSDVKHIHAHSAAPCFSWGRCCLLLHLATTQDSRRVLSEVAWLGCSFLTAGNLVRLLESLSAGVLHCRTRLFPPGSQEAAEQPASTGEQAGPLPGRAPDSTPDLRNIDQHGDTTVCRTSGEVQHCVSFINV